MHQERRRSTRVRTPHAEAICRQGSFAAKYRVCDLSTGGALLTSGPPLPIGDRYEIRVFVPGRRSIAMDGRVVRNGKGLFGLAFALSFEVIDADASDAIEELVAKARTQPPLMAHLHS